jgi:hypothetical protein
VNAARESEVVVLELNLQLAPLTSDLLAWIPNGWEALPDDRVLMLDPAGRARGTPWDAHVLLCQSMTKNYTVLVNFGTGS